MNRRDAETIMQNGLAKGELEFATSWTAPLYWLIRTGNNSVRVRNGTVFFIDTGFATFGVTAAHVIEGLNEDRNSNNMIACQLGSDLSIEIDSRIIDINSEIDVATFQISMDEIDSIRKHVFRGCNKGWPPEPPESSKGVLFAGYVGGETFWLSREEISFGICATHGVATSINNNDIVSLIEREHIFPVMADGIPPEQYDFGGISGGPLLTIVEHNGLRGLHLGGVIYDGPNPGSDPNASIQGFQMFKARRADFISANGLINTDRWLT